ncbi:MAG: hypothetical protein ACQEQC_05870 [Elusimicrobiota bacterium]
MDKKELELKSSAITLSDMEIFIFPELLYSLVLANIMSPKLWEWKDDLWFEGIHRKTDTGKLKRLKQYIMDNYVFNLDLNTWGLTDKDRELERFKEFISPEEIEKTNALFGYEGDKYYFDIDIRRHFGLDKYNDDVIPYWKTETLEAMNAFKYKEDYRTGAGECVSLSVLYAAAMFVVLEIPLEKIFLMATPLHSQNFINTGDGALTNNRRIITKSKWFNGTPLSMKARRALENEQVTMVFSNSGYIHTYYPEATIDKEQYEKFKENLNSYLRAPLNKKILGNFLRGKTDIHECIQYRYKIRGKDYYIALEEIFHYEEKTPYFFTHKTREHLLEDIDIEEFHRSKLPDRIVLNDLEDYVEDKEIDLGDEQELDRLKEIFSQDCVNAHKLIKELRSFCITEPRFPDKPDKKFIRQNDGIDLKPDMSRKEMVNRLEELSNVNRTAGLAFYAYRDISRTEPIVFLKAAVCRNPVCVKALKEKNIRDIISKVEEYDSESIYSSSRRLAQPDEVFNYSRGDGLEKCIMAANVIEKKDEVENVKIKIEDGKAVLIVDNSDFQFDCNKQISSGRWTIKPKLDTD